MVARWQLEPCLLQGASQDVLASEGPFVCLLVEVAEGGFLVQKKKQGQVQKEEPASAGPLEVHNMVHDKSEGAEAGVAADMAWAILANLAPAGGVVVPE